MATQHRQTGKFDRTGRQNSYRKSSDPAGQNPHNTDIQQPGKPGDFGNRRIATRGKPDKVK